MWRTGCGDRMDQDQINHAEWEDTDNWSGPKGLSVYFSKRDCRTWVRKQPPGIGWTINLGRTAGVCWLIAFLVVIPTLFLVIAAIIAAGRG